MAQKTKKKASSQYERPRVKSWIDPNYRAYLVMEPAKVALVAATLVATLTALGIFLYQALGSPISPMVVVLRLVLAFFVSYALVGLFVYYLLWVMQRELPEPEEEESEAAEEEAGAPPGETGGEAQASGAPGEEAGQT